ncbi:terminase-like family protein [Vibrio phage 1.148.O._10N.286.54.A10]|nr:terminase-like family protein [Vibrio phage 1.148.O._10N.286.54.A10]
MSDLRLSNPQNIFLNGLDTKFRAYVGGFGSGKTFVGCLDLLTFFGSHPGTRQGYFGPSYPAIRDIFYPTFEEAAFMMGFDVDIKESNKEVHVYRGRKYYGTVICRSMDKPNTIVGFKIARALVDELDVLDEKKATNAWNKIIARMRLVIDGVQNSIGVTTTPEGFKFVYHKFSDQPTASYSMVQASTYENEQYLPADYIPSLRESYPQQLIDAYLDGEFVNLNVGTVYTKYDPILNDSHRLWNGREALHIGCDFNVGRMCSVAHVIDNGNPIAVGEIIDGYDTPDMIRMIKQRYWEEISEGEFKRTCQIVIYPDSSGKNRKSVGASETDISLMRDAGFELMYKPSNPAIKDRVNAMNAMFCNGKGERRYTVNKSACPRYSAKLQQQVYKNQEPEKDGTEDVNDAGGYFIAYKYQIKKPSFAIPVSFSM